MKKWLTMMASLSLAAAVGVTACSKKEEANTVASTAESVETQEVPGRDEIIQEEDVEPVDIGQADDQGLYKNETIGFEIQLPKSWYIMNVEEMDAMMEANTANNPAAQTMLPYLTQLVVAYDQDNATEGVGINTIHILLQEPTEYQDAKSLMSREKENMEMSKEIMGTASALFEVSDLEEKTISGKTYYILSNRFTGANGESTSSDMYCTQLEDGTFLEMSFSYKDEAGKKAFEDAVSSIKHTK